MTNSLEMERLIASTLNYFLQADRHSVGSMVYQALRAAAHPAVTPEYATGYLDSTLLAIEVLGSEKERAAFGLVLTTAKTLVDPAKHAYVQPAMDAIRELAAA